MNANANARTRTDTDTHTDTHTHTHTHARTHTHTRTHTQLHLTGFLLTEFLDAEAVKTPPPPRSRTHACGHDLEAPPLEEGEGGRDQPAAGRAPAGNR